MIVPLQREFGWQNADISFALAIRLVLFGLIGPFAAAFMNRFGLRPVVSAALLLIVAGLAGSLVMTDGSASHGAFLAEVANFEENSPNDRCWLFSRIRPKQAMSQKAVAPPLPSTTS